MSPRYAARMRRWHGLALLVAGCGESLPGADASAPETGGAEMCVISADCDDGTFCNGDEQCDEGVCVAGASPCSGDCSESSRACVCANADVDGDGHDSLDCGGDDCDDTDAQRHPSATEVCDDEGVDEDCDAETFGDRDADGDGYPDAECCNGDVCGTDCDDADSNVAPNQTEACNETDDDCDGMTDEGVQRIFFEDGDGDGFGTADGETVQACNPPDGFAENDTDCNDDVASVNPGAAEVCDRYGDNDCNASTPSPFDDDQDGYDRFDPDICPLGADCDDARSEIRPGAIEVCDGLDSDCDHVRLAAVSGEDDDGDGQREVGVMCVGGPAGELPATDCDDANPNAFLGAIEVCDGADNDCDGLVDEGDVFRAELVPEIAVRPASGTLDLSCVGSRMLPASGVEQMYVFDVTVLGNSPPDGSRVEIWRSVSPGALGSCMSPTCTVHTVTAGQFAVSLPAQSQFAYRFSSPSLLTVSGGGLVAGLDDELLFAPSLITPSLAPEVGEGTLSVRVNDCMDHDLLDVTVRAYRAGVPYCAPPFIDASLLPGLYLALSVPAQLAGERYLIEAVGRESEFGPVIVLAREEMVAYPDEVSVLELRPLRAASPTP